MLEMIEWIDGKIALNKHMIENESKPSDFEMFLLADIDTWTEVGEGTDLLENEAEGLYWMPLPELPKGVTNE